MGILYRDYCYSTSATAAAVVNSESEYLISSSSGDVRRVIATVSGSDVTVGVYIPSAGTWISDPSVPPSSLPSCSVVGPVRSSSLDSPPVVDVVTASWLTAVALIAAWSVKIIRKSL